MRRVFSRLLDLTGAEIRALAAEAARAEGRTGRLAGRVVAVLPLGPTAESPAAWIAAAYRLGAGVLRRTDLEAGHLDDFELADAAARCADVVVASHPLDGFAASVGEATGRGVVNAGESGGEDPAAGIALVAAALEVCTETDRPLRVAVCGDLAQSRSARALLSALAALDASVLLVPAKGQDLPQEVMDRLARRGGPDRMVREPFRTRRRTGIPAGAEQRTSPAALEAALLFAAGALASRDAQGEPTVPERYRSGLGILCRAERCVAARRPDRVTPDFVVLSQPPRSLECRYCGARTSARFAASKVEGRFHAVGSAYASHVLPANLVLFESQTEALAAGFEPARRGQATEDASS